MVDEESNEEASGPTEPVDAGPVRADPLATSQTLAPVGIGFFRGLPYWASVLGALLALVVLFLGMRMLVVGLGDFLVVLFLAVIVAYLLDPVIDRMERAGINRSLAIAAALGSFLLVVTLTVVLLVPYVAHEVGQLDNSFETYLSDGIAWVGSVQTWLLEKTGVDLKLDEQLKRLPELLKGVSPAAMDPVKAILTWTATSTARMLNTIFTWSLFPIFAFFFLRDFDAGKAHLFELLPYRVRGIVLQHYKEIDAKIASFIRGQVLVALILAVLYSLGLLVATDIDLALLIGILAGLLFVIPYLGTMLGIALGTLMALLKFGVSFEMVKVWLVFGVVQSFEGALLTPKIVGDSVGLHPVTVMVSLLVGASLAGVLGMLIAVPVAAALSVVGRTALGWYRGTDWFQAGREGAPTGDDLP